jgi:hypothetical protein
MDQIEESIEIQIRYQDSESFPGSAVAKTIERVDSVVLEQEVRELENLARDLDDIPALALDAARHRLSVRSDEGVLFYSASQGSIVLCGVVAGLAAWILQQTLGETLKEAWIESDLHKKLKRLLLAGSRYKAEAIAQGIERNAIALENKKRIELRTNVETEHRTTFIHVHATLHAADLPPLRRISRPEYSEEAGPAQGRTARRAGRIQGGTEDSIG